jgi:hypothetical protein
VPMHLLRGPGGWVQRHGRNYRANFSAVLLFNPRLAVQFFVLLRDI